MSGMFLAQVRLVAELVTLTLPKNNRDKIQSKKKEEEKKNKMKRSTKF